MKVLELFFGTGSFSKEAIKHPDISVFGIDIIKRPDWVDDMKAHHLQKEILSIEPESFGYYDFVWASPPCDTFSTGGYPANHRRKDLGTSRHGEAISEKAKFHDQLVLHTLEIIGHIKPKWWIIENPRGLLRKMHFMQHLNRKTVCYCQYGDSRMKPTDLFGVFPEGFIPKMCKNDSLDCDHQRAPRGARTGTQGIPKHLRGQIPPDLCKELVDLAICEGL